MAVRMLTSHAGSRGANRQCSHQLLLHQLAAMLPPTWATMPHACPSQSYYINSASFVLGLLLAGPGIGAYAHPSLGPALRCLPCIVTSHLELRSRLWAGQDVVVELGAGEDSDAAGGGAQPAKRRKGSAQAAAAAPPGKVKAHGAAGALLDAIHKGYSAVKTVLDCSPRPLPARSRRMAKQVR